MSWAGNEPCSHPPALTRAHRPSSVTIVQDIHRLRRRRFAGRSVRVA
ncbi:hypothetical protein MF672_041125 [Actinomadura sp. ATCC 31491]|uniref:Uncharacterized protein n=1 Tax=Actinomadura luzonensis TaxID=2805427 RepID=A0ABT0G6C4_9ACTN|nr:hypothetical protein [Actinomadura luzonensis]MCK2220157.1 hypothetical protein [Actinomadura luzonensis]